MNERNHWNLYEWTKYLWINNGMYIFCEISDINKCSQKVTSSESTLPTPDNAVALHYKI